MYRFAPSRPAQGTLQPSAQPQQTGGSRQATPKSVSEHAVGVSRSFWHVLYYVPMLDDLAAL